MAMQKKPTALTPTATLLKKAALAKDQDPKLAPRLLLEALQQRIREVAPDHDLDFLVAARNWRGIQRTSASSLCIGAC